MHPAYSARAVGFADNPVIPNALVSITNLNATAFSDVWYVANYDTTLSNADRKVLGAVSAFRIDAIGANTPLVSESGVADGIFAPARPGSSMIQDYANVPGQSAALISDIGLPSADSARREHRRESGPGADHRGAARPRPARACALARRRAS